MALIVALLCAFCSPMPLVDPQPLPPDSLERPTLLCPLLTPSPPHLLPLYSQPLGAGVGVGGGHLLFKGR